MHAEIHTANRDTSNVDEGCGPHTAAVPTGTFSRDNHGTYSRFPNGGVAVTNASQLSVDGTVVGI
jgi:hypothetical protein